MRSAFKAAAFGASLALVLPLALIAAFGRCRPGFTFCAQSVALLPGIPGDYLRGAFYRLTLRACSRQSRISYGTFFSNVDAGVEDGVYIGSYCVIGCAQIGRGTQIASGVQILSGARQHVRDVEGGITGSAQGEFQRVDIGANCWIGAGSIVMADVGEGSTIGAGSIVTRAIPRGVVAVGNPARVIREAGA